ncbi:tetratricopeptide repeat-containing sensor histidine kinase [Algoriphagus kandeliae]|uniref:tetratricopeptide repeat-containing sensor histidine kinase n=1 Tax=Algoriphagus kandeliae TaxID=2562278 RepID=UPI0013873465|nr:tetratricopeptide repeat-containing sensor histidine kinase [Algoriphagus kandeliae]
MRRQAFYLIILISFFTCLASRAQDSHTDSLLIKLKGKERIDYLNRTATEIRESEQDLAIQYSFEADSLAKLIDDYDGRSRALENIGWIFYRRGQWLKSFDYSTEAYDLALLAENKLQAARLMNNLGALYYEQKNFDKAIEQFKRGYRLAKEAGDVATQIRSLNNVALNFTQSGRQDSAMVYANLSIKTNEQAGSPYLLSFANRVIGDVYLAEGNYDSAVIIYEKALEMARAQDVKSFEAGVIHRLGNAYLLNNQLVEAEKTLQYAVDFCKEYQFMDELAKSHKYLSQVYQKIGDYLSAYEQLNEFSVLNDTLLNKAGRDRLALMQGMFEEDLARSELELLKSQNEAQSYRLQTSRRYLIFFGFAFLIIALLSIRLFFLHRNLKKINHNLTIQQKKIEEQNVALEKQSKELLEINEAKNKLFSILSHDLRSPIGQLKSTLDLMLQKQLSEEEFYELMDFLKKDVDSINNTLVNTLKWSMSQMEGFEIQSHEFDLSSITKNSLNFLQSSIKAKNLTIFDRTTDRDKVYGDPDLLEVAVRNIISNAIKYSNPGDSITIFSEKGDEWIQYCILDQGIGMEKEQINQILAENHLVTKSQPGTQKEKGSGLGLKLVKEFVKMNGGKIEIESKPGHGTKFCIYFPINQSVQNLKPVH